MHLWHCTSYLQGRFAHICIGISAHIEGTLKGGPVVPVGAVGESGGGPRKAVVNDFRG